MLAFLEEHIQDLLTSSEGALSKQVPPSPSFPHPLPARTPPNVVFSWRNTYKLSPVHEFGGEGVGCQDSVYLGIREPPTLRRVHGLNRPAAVQSLGGH